MVGILESVYFSGTPNIANLVASYAFEGSTGYVIDGYNDNNGTINGAITRGSTGLVGNCFDFKGGAIEIPHNTSFNLLQSRNKNLAFSLWYKPDAIDPDGAWFFNKRGADAATQAEYQFSYFQGNLRVQIWNNDGSQFMLSAPFTIVAGTKYHICGFTDIATNSIILKVNNSALSGTITGEVKTFNVTQQPFVIGDRSWSLGVAPVLGLLDELRIWIGDTVPTDFTNEWNNGNGITR